MEFTKLQTNKTLENPSKIARCTRIPHPQALMGGARWPAAHQPESRPTRGLDPRRGAATASRGARARACACAATASGGGARRRGEAGPERGRGGAHGDAEVAARLTSGGAGEERRRTGGATNRGGGAAARRTGAAAALQRRGKGRMRWGMGRGGVGEASRVRDRGGAHRGWRIVAAGGEQSSGRRRWWRGRLGLGLGSEGLRGGESGRPCG